MQVDLHCHSIVLNSLVARVYSRLLYQLIQLNQYEFDLSNLDAAEVIVKIVKLTFVIRVLPKEKGQSQLVTIFVLYCEQVIIV